MFARPRVQRPFGPELHALQPSRKIAKAGREDYDEDYDAALYRAGRQVFMADRDAAAPSGQAGTILRVVVSAERIHRRVDELAANIAQCYQGRELVILGVMTGALVFLADLIRRLPINLRLSLISASSYDGPAICSNGIKSIGEVSDMIQGREVLIVDDILDSGHTLRALIEQVRCKGPQSVRTCVLLRKARARADRPAVDFLGFEIPDEFVVGYGLDFDNLYRNLPDLNALPCPGRPEGA
jgi:hypoxanthine phosphoribosyltransferase